MSENVVTIPDGPEDVANALADQQQTSNDNEVPEWVPEKFRNTEDPYKSMAEAYKELERKQGADQPQDSPDQQDQTPPQPEGDNPFQKYSDEYTLRGELSEQSYQELAEKGIPKNIVDNYINGIKSQTDFATEAEYQDALKAVEEVGGIEKFQTMMEWANNNLSDEQKAAYDRSVTGDVNQKQIAVNWLAQQYAKANGTPPGTTLEGGVGRGETVQGFKSTQEMVRAIQDPRYAAGDVGYIREVERKLSVSQIFE